MRNHVSVVWVSLAAVALAGCMSAKQAAIAPTQELHSPDRRLALRVTTTPGLGYSLAYDGVPLLVPSALGLELEGLRLGRPGVEVVGARVTSSDSTWETGLYKKGKVRDHYNQLAVTVRQKDAPGQRFEVVFRLYDDGLAFRYVLPKDLGGQVVVKGERTQFVFARDAKCWAGSQLSGYAGAQEWEFWPTHLGALPKDRPVGLPLLVETPAAAVAITESDLLDYPGLWVTGGAEDPPAVPAGTKMGGASVRIEPPATGPIGKDAPAAVYAHPAPLKGGGGIAKLTLPHATPWRVVMVAPSAGKLIESDLVMNLATPSKIGEDSWVKPGITAWDHWWHGGVKMDTATQEKYIQLAADMGWPYQLVDWQWYGPFNKPEADITKVNPAVDMPELLRFAKERNVRLLVWLHSNDAARNDAYKRAFPVYEQWGLAGVKIDFMDRDDQEMVNWYEDVCREAAKHHLMVNFHGAYKPTGLNRTYPNQITREGVLGNEYNRWSTRVTPAHRLTLPFTRFLAGPGDFTPGGFNNAGVSGFKVDGKDTEVQSTRAGELALFVLYDSPLTCACDSPEVYKGSPAGLEFLKVVPTVWRDVKVIDASVGEYLVEAREAKKDDWFLAAATNSKGRTLTVPLTFLPNGQFEMRVWKDAGDSGTRPTHLAEETRVVTNKDSVTIEMAPAGGMVARFQRP